MGLHLARGAMASKGTPLTLDLESLGLGFHCILIWSPCSLHVAPLALDLRPQLAPAAPWPMVFALFQLALHLGAMFTLNAPKALDLECLPAHCSIGSWSGALAHSRGLWWGLEYFVGDREGTSHPSGYVLAWSLSSILLVSLVWKSDSITRRRLSSRWSRIKRKQENWEAKWIPNKYVWIALAGGRSLLAFMTLISKCLFLINNHLAVYWLHCRCITFALPIHPYKIYSHVFFLLWNLWM